MYPNNNNFGNFPTNNNNNPGQFGTNNNFNNFGGPNSGFGGNNFSNNNQGQGNQLALYNGGMSNFNMGPGGPSGYGNGPSGYGGGYGQGPNQGGGYGNNQGYGGGDQHQGYGGGPSNQGYGGGDQHQGYGGGPSNQGYGGGGPNPGFDQPAPPKRPLVVNLSNQERGKYSLYMTQLDPTDSGKILANEVRDFFLRSNLPKETLKNIWLIVSSNNEKLNKEEFYCALRLIAYAQNNMEVSENAIRQNIPAPLPKFEPPKSLMKRPSLNEISDQLAGVEPNTHQSGGGGSGPGSLNNIGSGGNFNSGSGGPPSSHHQQQQQFNTQGGPPQQIESLPDDKVIDLTQMLIHQYEQIFDRFDMKDQKGLMSQMEAVQNFTKSGLNSTVLLQIWTLCDTGDTKFLDKSEVIMMMHWIAMAKKGIPIPRRMPLKFERFLKDYKRKLPGKDYLISKFNGEHSPANKDNNEQQQQQNMNGGYQGQQQQHGGLLDDGGFGTPNHNTGKPPLPNKSHDLMDFGNSTPSQQQSHQPNKTHDLLDGFGGPSNTNTNTNNNSNPNTNTNAQNRKPSADFDLMGDFGGPPPQKQAQAQPSGFENFTQANNSANNTQRSQAPEKTARNPEKEKAANEFMTNINQYQRDLVANNASSKEAHNSVINEMQNELRGLQNILENYKQILSKIEDQNEAFEVLLKGSGDHGPQPGRTQSTPQHGDQHLQVPQQGRNNNQPPRNGGGGPPTQQSPGGFKGVDFSKEFEGDSWVDFSNSFNNSREQKANDNNNGGGFGGF